MDMKVLPCICKEKEQRLKYFSFLFYNRVLVFYKQHLIHNLSSKGITNKGRKRKLNYIMRLFESFGYLCRTYLVSLSNNKTNSGKYEVWFHASNYKVSEILYYILHSNYLIPWLMLITVLNVKRFSWYSYRARTFVYATWDKACFRR